MAAATTNVFFRATSLHAVKPVGFEGHRRPAMQQYVLDNGYTCKPGTLSSDGDGNAACSHYMYAGLYAMGKLTVPQGRPTEVLAASIVTDFRQRRYGALTENKPADKPRRFYMDVDLEVAATHRPTEEDWTVLEGIIAVEVKRFWPGVDPNDDIFTALVLASGTRDVTMASGEPGVKAGVHIVFQNMFVDVDMALYMTSAIRARAQRVWTDKNDAWADCVDQAVYGKTRGLRWAWQLKCKTCPRCASTSPDGRVVPNRKGCTHCYGGVLPDVTSSMYVPTHFFHGDGTRTAVLECREEPSVDLLLAASIRYVDARCVTEGFKVYEGAAPRPLLRVTGKKALNVVEAVLDAGEPAKAAKATMLLRGCKEAVAVEAAARRVHAMYADIEVKYVHRSGNGNWYKVFVRNAGASYCLNVAKDHNHAQILFIVKRGGIQQVCQCRCDTVEGRVSGKRCRDYQSPLTVLLDGEKAALFPEGVVASAFCERVVATTCHHTTASEVIKVEEAGAVLPPSAAGFATDERRARIAGMYALQSRRAMFK